MSDQDSLTYTKTRFVKSAAKLSQCPLEIVREVAFAGRSNAGKSSALNCLTGNKKLARTSKTPGRTQLINYFQVGDDPLALVDLPGYGFAKVPLAVKEAWQKELDNYLTNRQALVGLVLLMDIRNPLKDFDQHMIRWADRSAMPVHILLTKADKLSRGPAQTALLAVKKALKDISTQVTIQTFSSLKGDGLDTLRKQLDQWLLPPLDATDSDDQQPG
ncbi:ribosome biogenesis GTP-binding protein YihA/YsxC [Thalassolituus sp. LLYu03]|uniref:ribosome biogenesis GTP-binding protein YihA/YsxC n=1 Tax=Thalassolituus sp. LLYu03 TaxID=3421656 RepID=UPI003D2CEF58